MEGLQGKSTPVAGSLQFTVGHVQKLTTQSTNQQIKTQNFYSIFAPD